MHLALLALVLSSPSAIAPTDLRCEYLVNPIGIDELEPRLSWIDVSSRRGAMQTAYQIEVASTPQALADGKADLWDSGKVESADSTQIEYKGKPLSAGQGAFWKVVTWDDTGAETTSRSLASWELGLPKADDWRAKWISLPTTIMDPLQIPAPYLRTSFLLDKPIARARAFASAKGLYKLYLNGKPAGNQLLTPGWTDYNKRVDYQTYDVTSLLHAGSNAVGIVLGNGWYCGHVGLTGGDNYGKNPEGIVQLEIDYQDGTKSEVVSDQKWKGSPGPIQSDDLLMGETYDARKEIAGWSAPKLNDASWQPVQTHDLDVPLVAQPSPPIQVITQLKAIKFIPQPQPNTYVFDMGQNMVGWARLKVRGPAGTTVTLRFAEMLNPDKSVYTTNLRGAKATDYYTLKGGGVETYEPTFTSHGFRYVEVTGYPGKPGLDAITGMVVGSNNPQVGQFSCSNPLVNQLQHNIYWGERGNYLSIPTDCPQRDERLGWMGDAQIFVRTATYNNDIAGFMTKWTQDEVDAQSPEGGFADVSPRRGDMSDGAPAWGDAGVIVPYTIYKAYGDKRLLARRYDAMAKWVHYIDSVNPDHIWINRSNNNFGDWLNVQDDTPREVLATAYFAYSTDLLARSAEALGKTEDAKTYHKLFSDIREAFNTEFVSADGTIKGDTQTDYVLALRFNLLPESMQAIAAKKLVDHIMIDRKGHLSTGFVGVGYLNPTLTSIGRTDVAYKLLTNDTYPSWGYSIRMGATTIWERWDGWTDTKGFQDPGMNSFNHYSLGSVGEWMYATVAGIDTDPSTPGYSKIVIHPIPGGGVTWAKGSLESPHGLISTDWKVDGDRFTLNVTIPANTTATVYVPAVASESVREGGQLATSSKGVAFQGMNEGFAIYRVASGNYRFSSTVK
jgi:alpha-L-rhamnosidase